jgi:hypothetical protein
MNTKKLQMKKVLLILGLTLGLSQLSTAQIQFGVKGGINYNSDSFNNVKEDVFSGAKGNAGFHAGLWFRGKIPIIGLYIRPEIVYTQLKNEVTYLPKGLTNGVSTTYSFQKVDVPVLIGKKFLGFANAFIGPSFQYIIDSGFGISTLEKVEISNFSMGIQFGAGIEFGKLGIDVRWERSLSDAETKFVDNQNGGDINFDTRTNQIILGLSYRL